MIFKYLGLYYIVVMIVLSLILMIINIVDYLKGVKNNTLNNIPRENQLIAEIGIIIMILFIIKIIVESITV